MSKPYGFIYNINLMYFRFATSDWFYPNPGYSEEMTKRVGWSFDGQMFFKTAPSKAKGAENE